MNELVKRLQIGSVAALLLVSSCVAPANSVTPDVVVSAPDFELTADANSFRRGDRVGLRFANWTDQRVEVGLCFAHVRLERFTADAWERVEKYLGPQTNTPIACVDIAALVGPGAEALAQVYLPRDLAPGTYRLAVFVLLSASNRVRVPTSSFAVF